MQSISNNFMELNNGKFGFDLPMKVSMDMEDIVDWGESHYFAEKPLLVRGGTTTYTSGPKSGYKIEVIATNDLVDSNSVNFSGNAGSNFNYTIDFSDLRAYANQSVSVQFKRDGVVLDEDIQSFAVTPIYGTYKLLALNGAPNNNSTVVIEPILGQTGKYYKVSGSLFGKELVFEDDGTGQIECYDTFWHLGEEFTNIYFYDDSPNVIHMAIHSANYHLFYQLLRQ